jgi:tetratricopeptide (TPR) repeat protein
VADAALLARRLANLRREAAAPPAERAARAQDGRRRTAELAARLAEAVDGEAVATDMGTVVRVERPSFPMALDRHALADLPGQPPPDVPLLCLDTETTGLATAAGTVAFLIGVGWWEGQRFRQVQLLLPDHPEEPALLTMLASLIPAHGWLVTYNGRSFDWPLLVARFRMFRRDGPAHAGHLDLLTTVRRLFRHRMADARLRTAEETLLGFGRLEDVEGWEIPGRYHEYLRGGNPAGLAPVLEHNERDVRSLARILVHLGEELADDDRRRQAPDGDLLGLARAYAREGRPDTALDCIDAALSRPPRHRPLRRPRPGLPPSWLVDRSDGVASAIAELSEARAGRLTRDQIRFERARLLRRLGRRDESRDAWRQLAEGAGPLAAVAWIELAKHMEHVERDMAGALDAVRSAERLAEHAAALGRRLPVLEADLGRRRSRLERRRLRAGRRVRLQVPAPRALRPAPQLGEALAHAFAND